MNCNKIIRSLVLFPLLFSIVACGGGNSSSNSGEGSSGTQTGNSVGTTLEPKWEETYSNNGFRHIYTGRLQVNGLQYVNEEIPINQPLTIDNANSYEIRTTLTDGDITSYLFKWSDGMGKERSYKTSSGQYHSYFSESLRSERRTLYASRYRFIAWGNGETQIECYLVEAGDTVCNYYDEIYTFTDLEYPLVTGVKDIEYPVIIENIILEAVLGVMLESGI